MTTKASFVLTWIIIIVGTFLVFFLALGRGCFVSEAVAVEAVRDLGYTNIQVTDKAWFAVGFRGCSESDAVRFTVTGTSPSGEQRQVFVCSGWLLKNATVRH